MLLIDSIKAEKFLNFWRDIRTVGARFESALEEQ